MKQAVRMQAVRMDRGVVVEVLLSKATTNTNSQSCHGPADKAGCSSSTAWADLSLFQCCGGLVFQSSGLDQVLAQGLELAADAGSL